MKWLVGYYKFWFLREHKSTSKRLHSGPVASVNLAPQDRCFFLYLFMLTWSMGLTPCLLYRDLLMQVMHSEEEFKSWARRKCFAYKLQFNMCMHNLHWQQKYVVSKVTPVALRQTWINAHCTETEGRDNLCLWEKVRTHAVTQRDCGTNIFKLFITLQPLLKWKQGTSFEEEGTHTEFKHAGHKKIAY